MIEYHYDVEQGSDEWHDLRCGILTASEVKLILTPTLKVANNDKTRQHVYEIAAQRVTKYTEPQYISDDMLRGMSDEILAVDLYSSKYHEVKPCGFITNSNYGFVFGYSPDGLVGEDGLIEIKSRSQKYQMQTISNNQVPDDYMLQIQTGLFLTQRKWLDFISYCGGMPMFVKRVFPQQEYFDAIQSASEGFEEKVNEVIKAYNKNSVDLHHTEREDKDIDII
jgi:predicted phage-related endonuclease